MLPPLVLLLAPIPVSAPAPPATYARTVSCVLELHGSLNTRRRGSGGTETVSDTFQLAVPGWLEEQESAAGAVTFTFSTAPDPRFPPTGMLNQRTRIQGPSRTEVQFYGSQFQLQGPLRFSAGLRGQNLYPAGVLEVGGYVLVQDAKGTHEEPRTMRFVPFPEIRSGPGDFAAPTLRFEMSSLWRLRKATGPFAARGSVTYRNSSTGASYAGRVEVTFKLDPRTTK